MSIAVNATYLHAQTLHVFKKVKTVLNTVSNDRYLQVRLSFHSLAAKFEILTASS